MHRRDTFEATPGRLSIGFGAVEHCRNIHDVAFDMEENPVVADSQPGRASEVTVQRADIAATSAGVMEYPIEDAHGCLTVDPANICTSRVTPVDAIR